MSITGNLRNLISMAGEDATLRNVTQGAYNTATGTASTTTADSTVRVLVNNVTDEQVSEPLIQRGDYKISFRPVDTSEDAVAVTPGDQIILNSVTLTVKQVDTLRYNDAIIMYNAYCRE